jgi:NADPH:quinone reductase-like Zn-dependent oxidoreductase
MIHGASSGVGLMGLQIASCSARQGDRHLDRCGAAREAGRVRRRPRVDPREAGWHQQVVAATGGKGVDVIVDQVTGPEFNRTMQAAAVGAHRQRRPSRRRRRPVRLPVARAAAHQLHRRHLPHALGRRDPRAQPKMLADLGERRRRPPLRCRSIAASRSPKPAPRWSA